jgi:hypothetical protein
LRAMQPWHPCNCNMMIKVIRNESCAAKPRLKHGVGFVKMSHS